MARRGIVFLFLLFTFFTPCEKAFAYDLRQNECDFILSWGEFRTEHFAIIYSSENIGLAQSIVSLFAKDLDKEYEQFSSAFGVSLQTPISIRLYPDANYFYCLNALSPLLGEKATHSHIGFREISLIAENIQADFDNWREKALNGFRHELVVLFGEQVSNGNTPVGLLAGLGGYAEDPVETFEERYRSAGNIVEPTLMWQALWEGDALPYGESEVLQATSIVAYLIDVYGWNSFLDFLRNIADSEGYRQALLDAYGFRIQELQNHWSDYFIVYITDRWRFNVFHNYHLEAIRELISAGAYADAVKGLQEAIPLIEIFGEEGNLDSAYELLALSQLGIQAGALVADARQALVSGEYQECIDLSSQALDIYNQLEDDRRLGELDLYISVAQEVLSLRSEVEEIKQDIPYPGEVKRLIDIGKRLSELGDQQGVSATEVVLAVITAGQRKFFEWLFGVGIVIVLFLLLRRIFHLKDPSPPETELL
jgi:hypothetical protein